jgi:hypothetical protein
MEENDKISYVLTVAVACFISQYLLPVLSLSLLENASTWIRQGVRGGVYQQCIVSSF